MTQFEVRTAQGGLHVVAADDWKITESGALVFYARTTSSSREAVQAFAQWLNVREAS